MKTQLCCVETYLHIDFIVVLNLVLFDHGKVNSRSRYQSIKQIRNSKYTKLRKGKTKRRI